MEPASCQVGAPTLEQLRAEGNLALRPPPEACGEARYSVSAPSPRSPLASSESRGGVPVSGRPRKAR